MRNFLASQLSHNRVKKVALAIFLASACWMWAVIVHDYFSWGGKSPIYEVDDELLTVSYTLADFGKPGRSFFPAIGVNHKIVPQTEHILIYGPWYFYIGGALSWLFGESLVVQRSIHLWGVVAVSAFAFFAFRRYAIPAAGVTAVGLAWVFTYANWPMVRPDIMVATFGMLSVLSATFAIERSSPRAWCVAFFAATAAFNQHFIGFGYPVLICVLFAVAFLVEKLRDTGNPWFSPHLMKSVFAAFCGVFIALFFYLVPFGIQHLDGLAEIWKWAIEGANTGKSYGYGDRSYFEIFMIHYTTAWRRPFWIVSDARYLIAGFYLLSVILLAFVLLTQRGRAYFAARALLLPPVVFGIGYSVTLGFYPNNHSGYALFSQFIVMWLLGGWVALGLYVVTENFRAFRSATLVTSGGLAAIAMVYMGLHIYRTENPWQYYAKQYVDGEKYHEQLIEPLDEATRVWGPITISMGSARKLKAVHLNHALGYASGMPALQREGIRPDALVIGWDVHWLAYRALSREASNLSQLPGYFPKAIYRQIKLVTAPPYGPTTVFRADLDKRHFEPTVAFSDGVSRSWSSNLGRSFTAPAENAKDAIFRWSDANQKTVTATASATRGYAIREGTYLFKVKIENASPKAFGALIGSTVLDTFISSSTHLRQHAFTFYDPRAGEAYILVNHKGGVLYLSLFDMNTNATFEVESIRPVWRVNGNDYRAKGSVEPKPFKVLAPMKWNGNPANFNIQERGDKPIIDVVAKTTGCCPMLLQSENVSIDKLYAEDQKKYMDVKLEVNIPFDDGVERLGIGVLDSGTGRWLASPQPAAKTMFFKFSHPSNYQFALVFASLGGNKQPQFSLKKGEGVSGNLTLVPSSVGERSIYGLDQFEYFEKVIADPK